MNGRPLFQFPLGKLLVIVHIRTRPKDDPADVFEGVEEEGDNQRVDDKDDENQAADKDQDPNDL